MFKSKLWMCYDTTSLLNYFSVNVAVAWSKHCISILFSTDGE